MTAKKYEKSIKKNNLIYIKDSNSWVKYDSRGNIIYSRDADGVKKWRKYDENNRLVYYKSSNGYEYRKEYDADGNEVINNRANNDVRRCVLKSVTALALTINTLLSIATVWYDTFTYTKGISILWAAAQVWLICIINANCFSSCKK